MEKRLLSPLDLLGPIHIFFFCFFFLHFVVRKEDFFSNREHLLLDADSFQVMKFSKESRMHQMHQPHTLERTTSAEAIPAADLFPQHPMIFHQFLCFFFLFAMSEGKWVTCYNLQHSPGASVLFFLTLYVIASYQLPHTHLCPCNISLMIIWPFLKKKNLLSV